MDSEKEIIQLRKRAFYLDVVSSFATKLLQSRTEDDVVWTIAKHAVAKLGYIDCVVYLIDDEGAELYQRAAHGPKNPIDFDIHNPIVLKVGQGIVGSVAKLGKGEIIANTQQDSRYLMDDQARLSEIAIPILAGDRVLGIIDSEHPEENFYNNDDFEVLTTIASMASAKLEELRIQMKLLEHKTTLEDIVLSKTKKLQETVLQLQKSNLEITAQNREKEILIKEIHHRVKNNLQILSSLMNLQSHTTNSKREQEVFQDCRNRILSMSAIHDQLYTSGNMTEINARQYISEITDDLLRTFGALERVELQFEVEERIFDIDTSIPLGLIVNELIVNSLKHGIKGSNGVLRISLLKTGNSILLEVEDSGSGFAPSESSSTSLGMELINTLASQLGGEVSYLDSELGTLCRLQFPMK